MPKLPKRTPRKKNSNSRETTPRKYTQMALLGLEAGLSWEDMRHMKFTHLQQIIWEWEDMHGAEYDEVRDATGADVRALTRM